MCACSGRGGNQAGTDLTECIADLTECIADLTECIASRALRVDDEHRLYQGIAPHARNWCVRESVVFQGGNHNSSEFFPTYFLPCWDGNLRAEFGNLEVNTKCLVVHVFSCAISSVSILFFSLFLQISNVGLDTDVQ